MTNKIPAKASASRRMLAPEERAFLLLKETMDASPLVFQQVDRTPGGWTCTRRPPSCVGLERFTVVFKVSTDLINSLWRLGFLDTNFTDPKGFASWKEAEKVRKREGLPKLSVWMNDRGLEAYFWCHYLSGAANDA